MQLASLLPLLAGLCALLVAFAMWIRRKERESVQRVAIDCGQLIFSFASKIETLPIAAILEIRYSWIAAVYFGACWEFDGESAVPLKVDSKAAGLGQVLLELEQLLPGFSVEKVKLLASEGDVHGETLCAWRAA
jgi:hypothetical protein